MRSPRPFVVSTLLLTLAAPAAWAHKLLLDCRVRNDRLRVEAFYDNDEPAEQAKIVVENQQKQIVAEGVADDRGIWSCPVPPPGVYTVRASSVGHAAKEQVTIEGDSSAKEKMSELPRSENNPPSPSAMRPEQRGGVPWMRVAIGLGIIAVLSLAAMITRRMKNRGERSA